MISHEVERLVGVEPRVDRVCFALTQSGVQISGDENIDLINKSLVLNRDLNMVFVVVDRWLLSKYCSAHSLNWM